MIRQCAYPLSQQSRTRLRNALPRFPCRYSVTSIMLSKSSAPNVVFAMSSTYKVYLPLSRILLSVLISLSSHASLASLASIFATVSRLLLYPSPSSFPILPQFPGSLFPVIICLHHAYRLPSTDRLSNSVILYTLCNASLCVGLVACS